MMQSCMTDRTKV